MSGPEDAVASRTTTIEPTLSVRRGAAAIAFYTTAFDARTLMRIDADDGAVVARLAIGAATFWVADESPEHGNFSPETPGGATTRLILTVEDPHAVFAHALAAGATIVAPVEEQPYGWLAGRAADPFGHHWEIGKPLVVGTLPSPHHARPRSAAKTLVRAYVVTTGTAFGLILLAHIARVATEGWQVAMQPVFALSSVASLGVCGWALSLWRPLSKPPTPPASER